MPVTATWSTWSTVIPVVFNADSQASAPSGTYRVSPNRSSHTRERRSPGVRQRSRNSSLTEAPPRYSAITGVPGASSPTRMAAAPSPPADSSVDVGRPSRRSDSTTRVVPAPLRLDRRAPVPDRRAPPKSKAPTSDGWRSAEWMAVALVLSR